MNIKWFSIVVVAIFYTCNIFSQTFPIIRLSGVKNVSGSTADETIICFRQGATDGFDSNFDAYKMMNSSYNIPNFWSIGQAETYSINALTYNTSCNRTINLGFEVYTTANWRISATQLLNFNSYTTFYLEDTELGIMQDLRINPVYDFTMNANAPNNRFKLHIISTVPINAGGSTSFCQGDSIPLSTLTNINYTYLWIHNNVPIQYSSNSILYPKQAGNYSVIISDNTQCADTSDAIAIVVNPNPVVFANASNTIVCSGNLITLTGNGAASYSWDNNVVDGTPFIPLATTLYTVTGTTNGCSNTDTISVFVFYIAGDINCDGIILFPEIAGDINGNGLIDRPAEIAGDINGDGIITLPEIAGDVNGNETINASEIAGDNNGNGIINPPDETLGDNYWLGTTNSDWNTPSNWSNNMIPSTTTNAIINGVINQPLISSAAAVKNLTINNGATLSISGSNILTLKESLTNNGTATIGGNIIFDGISQTVTGTTIFNNLQINTGSIVTFTSGDFSVLEIILNNGIVNTNDKLTLISNASGTALIDGAGIGIFNGKITMQRYLPSSLGYKHVCSPMNDAVINEFADDMTLYLGTTSSSPFPTFYMYDETNPNANLNIGWDNAGTTATIMPAMKGYSANFGAVSAPNTFDIFGTPNNGAKSIAVTNTASGTPTSDGWNLVGNPYPSPIDWDASTGWIKTNINNGIYFYNANDHYTGNYSTYINGYSTNGGSNIIPSMHAFWVKASDNGILAMDNNVRTTDLNPTIYKKAAPTNPFLKLLATNANGDNDETVIYFDASATAGFDSNSDAYKMMNTDNLPNFFSIIPNNERLSINAQAELVNEKIVPLGFNNMAGTYTIRASEASNFDADVKIYLEDVAMGISINLNEQQTYNFTLFPNETNNRFFVHFIKSTGTGINTADNNALVYISSNNKNVNVSYKGKEKATVEIYSLLGQPVAKATTINSGIYNFNLPTAGGYYTVRVITEGKVFVRKVFIN